MKNVVLLAAPVPSAPAPSRWRRICRTASGCWGWPPATMPNCCSNRRANTGPKRFPSATRERPGNCEACSGYPDAGLFRRGRVDQTRHAAGGGHCAYCHCRHGGIETGAGRHSRGQGHRHRVKGNSRHGRRNRDERGAQTRRARAGGGQRTLGDFSMSRRQTARFRPQTLAHSLRRAVSRRQEVAC